MKKFLHSHLQTYLSSLLFVSYFYNDSMTLQVTGAQYQAPNTSIPSFPNTLSSLKLSNAQELLIIPTTNFHESFIIPQVCYYIISPFVWSTWIHNADRVIFLKHTIIFKRISKNCISHTPFVRVQAHHDVDTIRFLSIFSHFSFLCSFCFE